MRISGAIAVAVTIGVSAASADEVDNLGGSVLELDARVRSLDRDLKPSTDSGPDAAERRLIDAQVLYELKNYDAASTLLFDVVEKYPNSRTLPEALYYLGDSLYLKRDFLSSRHYFQKLVSLGPQAPRYQEGLQRLIELSLHTGDFSEVDSYLAALERTPVQNQLPSVPYVKGKYFFMRKQYDQSTAALSSLPPSHPYYMQGQYFIGAAAVAKGADHLSEAEPAFANIVAQAPTTDAQRRVVELAHMALARIAQSRGDLTRALSEYGKISPRSELYSDALYESAWVAIRNKGYSAAARSLDLLVLNAPDSPLVPEVKLLLGSLQIRQQKYSQAADQFAKTRDEYAPLRKMLEDNLAKMGDATEYFRGLISKNLSSFDTSDVLPPIAVKWLKTDPEFSSVNNLIGDISDVTHSLDESEEIVARLEKALKGPARYNVFPELAEGRNRALDAIAKIGEIKTKLAGREADLLGQASGGDVALLKQLNADRLALESRLQKLPSPSESIAERQEHAKTAYNELDRQLSEAQTNMIGLQASLAATRKYYEDDVKKKLAAPQQDGAEKELDQWKQRFAAAQKEIELLRKEIADARLAVGVSDTDVKLAAELRAEYDDLLKRQHAVAVEIGSRLGAGDRAKVEQIESIVDRTRNVEQLAVGFLARVEDTINNKLSSIEAELGQEKKRVVAYRDRLGGVGSESATVGGSILALNFQQVAARFYNVVVRADVGIIDIAWALKDNTTREENRLIAERKRELKLLDDQFKDVLKEQP